MLMFCCFYHYVIELCIHSPEIVSVCRVRTWIWLYLTCICFWLSVCFHIRAYLLIFRCAYIEFVKCTQTCLYLVVFPCLFLYLLVFLYIWSGFVGLCLYLLMYSYICWCLICICSCNVDVLGEPPKPKTCFKREFSCPPHSPKTSSKSINKTPLRIAHKPPSDSRISASKR